jgi:hypothetical protein
MAQATEAFFKRSSGLDFRKAFPEKPASVSQVLDFMELHVGDRA